MLRGASNTGGGGKGGGGDCLFYWGKHEVREVRGCLQKEKEDCTIRLQKRYPEKRMVILLEGKENSGMEKKWDFTSGTQVLREGKLKKGGKEEGGKLSYNERLTKGGGREVTIERQLSPGKGKKPI